ncbi:MAG: VapC toxin family PIN domain ribonuclease [Verrucomicrobia bacterium]|nr:VapC toxin family PIN domain ribonuclease [Verrucomicrobiota bacterium]
MNYLLDANGLAALVIPQHEHHQRAHRFFTRRAFALTPLTQLALLQILSRPRRVPGQILPALHTPAESLRLLRLLSHRRGVQFVPADLNCAGPMPFAGVTGHRQWNDLYLVALAQKRGMMLATFDSALPVQFPEVCKLIP